MSSTAMIVVVFVCVFDCLFFSFVLQLLLQLCSFSQFLLNRSNHTPMRRIPSQRRGLVFQGQRGQFSVWVQVGKVLKDLVELRIPIVGTTRDTATITREFVPRLFPWFAVAGEMDKVPMGNLVIEQGRLKGTCILSQILFSRR